MKERRLRIVEHVVVSVAGEAGFEFHVPRSLEIVWGWKRPVIRCGVVVSFGCDFVRETGARNTKAASDKCATNPRRKDRCEMELK
jgi:hypothetical protein